MSKWIKFAEIPFPSKSGKTFDWPVFTVDGEELLGNVKWFGRWRKYAFFPAEGTAFEEVCLSDIAAFCIDQTLLKRQKAPHEETE